MIIKYAIALAVLLVLAAVVRLGVPARPGTCPATGPGTCGSACTCGCTPARASPTSSACGCAGAAWPRCAAPAGSARACRCGTGSPDPRQHSVFLGRAHYRHRLRVPLEEHLLVMAPPRTYKTAFLADVILSYPGPVIATSTKADLYSLDQRGARPARPGARVQPAAHRRRPLHLLLVPGRRMPGPGHRHPPRRRVRVRRLAEGRGGRHVLVRQSLATTCAATSTPPPWPATTCARSPPGCPAPTRTSPSGSCSPPAPASGPTPWPNSAPKPTRPPPPSGWSCPERWPSWPTRPWPPRAPAGPGGGFDIPAFLADRGTVYLIAEAVSEEAPVAPLFAAMATEMHYVAAQIGQASASGRLDPPLLMGLDEVTQICPVPLPFWLSDSGGKGIQVCAVVHGEAQLAERWGEHGRQVVLDTSSVKVFLPGITDTTTLQAASTLCGQASWKLRGQDHVTRHDVATPDMIRQLPAGFALVIRGGCAPVIARLPRAWRNPAYRRARRLGQAPGHPGAELPPPAEGPHPDIPDHVPDHWTPSDGASFPWS